MLLLSFSVKGTPHFLRKGVKFEYHTQFNWTFETLVYSLELLLTSLSKIPFF